MRLVDFTGEGLARLGADARLLTGEYRIAQRWSLEFRDHPDRPDGILYRSRHDPSRTCVALYERVAGILDLIPLGSFAGPGNAAMLTAILDHYAFGLIEDAR